MPSQVLADNGDELTPGEARAIAALRRLARRWPPTLELISMGGGLHVIHTSDPRYSMPHGVDRQEAVLADIDGIPNDGGDW
jgi:hypothetical protein